jgi:hypothetical protein
MNSLKAISLSVIVILTMACEEAKFTEPQPIDATRLESIPKELRGIFDLYSAENDSTFEKVDEVIVAKKYEVEKIINNKIKNIYHTKLNEGIVVKQVNDGYIINIYDDGNDDWSIRWAKISESKDIYLYVLDAEKLSSDSLNITIQTNNPDTARFISFSRLLDNQSFVLKMKLERKIDKK